MRRYVPNDSPVPQDIPSTLRYAKKPRAEPIPRSPAVTFSTPVQWPGTPMRLISWPGLDGDRFWRYQYTVREFTMFNARAAADPWVFPDTPDCDTLVHCFKTYEVVMTDELDAVVPWHLVDKTVEPMVDFNILHVNE